MTNVHGLDTPAVASRDASHVRPIEALIAQFASVDGVVREQARKAIVKIGAPAISYLINALNHPSVRMRWEATKALCEIGDPSAAPALVGRLEGQDSGIRWMAADGLIALGTAALEPVLQALIQRSDSILLREGAHRVLYGLAGRSQLQATLRPVLDALAAIEPAVVVPIAAYRALDALRAMPHNTENQIVIRKLLVSDWMTSNPYTLPPTAALQEAADLMKQHHIRRIPVVNAGQLVGIVSLGDIREALLSQTHTTLAQIMTAPVYTVTAHNTLRTAARLMLEHKLGGLPVVSGTEVIGIITESDIFRVLAQELTT